MKLNVLLFTIALTVATGLAARPVPALPLPSFDQVQMPTYEVPATLEGSTLLTWVGMDFGSSRILNEEVIAPLQMCQVLQIDLVYTRFPLGSEEMQRQLNQRRMNALLERMPWLGDGSSVAWRWVEQTACATEAEAQGMFHGFVIVHGVSWSQEAADAFQRRVKKAMETGRREAFVDSSAKWMMTRRQFDLYVKEHDLVAEVMGRHPEWKHKLVVQDVTGSMMPYYEQMLVWHALGGPRASVEGYLFFNDGDMRPDDQKRVGRTGGLYFTAEQDISLVMMTLIQATMAGFGGDGPENNVEALIEGIRQAPDAKEVILIADNWATPRDMELLSQVKRPVRVILCGAYMGVNVEYLELARRTGGSVHTVEQDLEHLLEMREGQEVELGDQRFRIQGGSFVPVI